MTRPVQKSSATDGFTGFPPGLFAFFEELSRHNDRDWFAANKARYRADVVDPMVRFIEAMAPRLRRISSHFVADPRPNGGSMFRICRDIRFSPDKRPYKEHAACHFRHAAGRDAHAPGYYVHLEPGQVFFGGGIWLPPGEALAAIRTAIDKDRNGWRRVVTDKRLVEVFGGIEGESLKRPPRGYGEDHPHIADLKRKSFYAMREVEPAAALAADFPDRVAETFRAATPLLRFLARTLGQPF